MTAISLPDNAIKYVLYQRTAYLVIPKTRPYKLLNRLSPWSLYKHVVALEAMFRRRRVAELFSQDMDQEYDLIKSWLPANCRRVLDIGCGVAGIDVCLFQHYRQAEQLEFHLLDKTQTEQDVFYRYEQRGAFYNSLEVARSLLMLNGVDSNRIHLHEATSDSCIGAPVGLDLVVSLISWGFHYPVSTYLEQAHSVLREGGRLILDVRKGHGGEEEIADRFSGLDIIHDAPKFVRVGAIK